MATPREIRRRIRSVRNISQITRAMEMVAASKMRRAQQQVIATRPYAERIRAMIGDLAALGKEEQAQFPLLVHRPIKRSMVILITADKGLSGSFNTNIIRRSLRFMSNERPEGIENIDMIAVGRRGRDFYTRYGKKLVADFPQKGDAPSFESIRPMVQIAVSEFINGNVDAVYVAYTRFINTLRQSPEIQQILPIEAPEGSGEITDYIFEPSPAAVLEALLPRFVEVQIYQALLESIASQFSAQMVAMRNATDNAHELARDLTLLLNRVRQTQITSEVSEIAAGAAAISH
ncbi:MAG TPA: F0F1 ATP synthase subunit gamma [Nitrolancea sp.]|nr:F0F1 ATP synthase subunit gamma [Nitrolancea sp.]